MTAVCELLRWKHLGPNIREYLLRPIECRQVVEMYFLLEIVLSQVNLYDPRIVGIQFIGNSIYLLIRESLLLDHLLIKVLYEPFPGAELIGL